MQGTRRSRGGRAARSRAASDGCLSERSSTILGVEQATCFEASTTNTNTPAATTDRRRLEKGGTHLLFVQGWRESVCECRFRE